MYMLFTIISKRDSLLKKNICKNEYGHMHLFTSDIEFWVGLVFVLPAFFAFKSKIKSIPLTILRRRIPCYMVIRQSYFALCHSKDWLVGCFGA